MNAAGPALLGPADARRLARGLNIRPTKMLGQNFVVDPNTVRRIVRTARVRQHDVVVEIGPGLGSLTLALLAAASHVVAVEIDAALAGALATTAAERAPQHAERLNVVNDDALDIRDLPGPPPTALVANLPYNVAVPVILTMLERFGSIDHGLVMVQSEVADRLVAAPGSRIYGAPSVKLAWYADASRAGAVPRSVFWPVPNVDSALVRFTRHEALADVARESVFAVVDAAFGQRRKTLRSALSPLAGGAHAAEAALRNAGVDPAARGESLDVAAYARIAYALTA